MKRIKLNFCGFWSNFDKEDNLFCDILSKHFKVEITDNPDFLIASPLGEPLEYLKYNCVRILFTGEPLAPDFNVFDYAIGFDHISFPDTITTNRYFRYPLCLYDYKRIKQFSRGLSYSQAKEALAEKKYFCNFIYGHKSARGERESILSAIQKYKRVESAGSFLNNMPDGKIIPYSEKKMDFLKLCKFTIACESISYPGFVTEKLVNPFCSNSVPIYFGNPCISTEFNPKAMINMQDYPSLEEGVERVIEVDCNDELYIRMLMEPKFVSDSYLEEMYVGLEKFLVSIFQQEPESAYRRMRYYIQKEHEQCLDEYRRFCKSIGYRIFKKPLPKRDS